MAVDLATRKLISVKLADYEVADSLKGCIDSSRLPALLPLLKSVLQLAKKGSV